VRGARHPHSTSCWKPPTNPESLADGLPQQRDGLGIDVTGKRIERRNPSEHGGLLVPRGSSNGCVSSGERVRTGCSRVRPPTRAGCRSWPGTNSETPWNCCASSLIVCPFAKFEANTPAQLCSFGIAPSARVALTSEAVITTAMTRTCTTSSWDGSNGCYGTQVAFRNGTPVWPMLPLSGPLKPWATVLAKVPTAPGALWPSAAAPRPKQVRRAGGVAKRRGRSKRECSCSSNGDHQAFHRDLLLASAMRANPPSHAATCNRFRPPGRAGPRRLPQATGTHRLRTSDERLHSARKGAVRARRSTCRSFGAAW